MAKYRVKKGGLVRRKLHPKAKYVAPKLVSAYGGRGTKWSYKPSYDPKKHVKFVHKRAPGTKSPKRKGIKRWGPRTIKRASFLSHYQGGWTHNW